VMTVADADGVTHRYYFKAAGPRAATRHAREWVARTAWSATLVEVRSLEQAGVRRRLAGVLRF
jgi:hypothetical protein